MSFGPGAYADLDQRDAHIRDAVRIVLDGVNTHTEAGAIQAGLALKAHLARYSETEIRDIAHLAIVRLAEALDAT